MEPCITSGLWKGFLGRGLAPRELQCTLLIAQGATAKQIAQQLGMAQSTVSKRISSVMFKLGTNRQTALVAEALRRGLIAPLLILLTLHSVISPDDHMRRDRRAPERRSEIRLVRARLESSQLS